MWNRDGDLPVLFAFPFAFSPFIYDSHIWQIALSFVHYGVYE